MSTPFKLLLPRQFYTGMLDQAQAELPNECCGLLAGRIEDDVGRVMARFPLINQLASPREFFTEARSLIAAHKEMRNQNIRELAFYHSHPISEPVPSRRDLDSNTYGTTVIHLIIGQSDSGPTVRGWWLNECDFMEANMEIIE